jgi:HAD superfamily hydrolase (TIGR01509 family)
MIHALVFDFDGVLADSEPLHLRATQETVAALGLTLTREEYYARYLGYDDVTMFRVMGEQYGLALDERQVAALVARKAEALDEVMLGADVLYPGAAECVERMARAYPLGIASGALRHEIEAILARHRLDSHFRFIVASGDTPASKPAPDPYRRAAELHARPPAECLAIEDSRWGIESATRAGLRCVGITNTYPASELTGADGHIGSLAELTEDYIRTLRIR